VSDPFKEERDNYDYHSQYEHGVEKGDSHLFDPNMPMSEKGWEGRRAGAREKDRRDWYEAQQEKKHRGSSSGSDWSSDSGSIAGGFLTLLGFIAFVVLASFFLLWITQKHMEYTRSKHQSSQEQLIHTPIQPQIPWEERRNPPERRGWIYENGLDIVQPGTTVIMEIGDRAYLNWINVNLSHSASSALVDKSRFEFRFSSSNGAYSITEFSNITKAGMDRNERRNLQPGEIYSVTPGTQVFEIHPVNERMSFNFWWQLKSP
jgi:hypothetical protein